MWVDVLVCVYLVGSGEFNYYVLQMDGVDVLVFALRNFSDRGG